MRAAEIFNLDWKQVNLVKGIITLYAEQTKTNEGRKVPISPLLHDTISRLSPKRGPVFMYHGKSVASVKNAFKSAREKAEIENFCFHDFRHTFVTNMRRAGKQDRVIMAITGHKTFSVFTRCDTVSEEDILGTVNGAEVGSTRGEDKILGTNLAQ